MQIKLCKLDLGFFYSLKIRQFLHSTTFKWSVELFKQNKLKKNSHCENSSYGDIFINFYLFPFSG